MRPAKPVILLGTRLAGPPTEREGPDTQVNRAQHDWNILLDAALAEREEKKVGFGAVGLLIISQA